MLMTPVWHALATHYGIVHSTPASSNDSVMAADLVLTGPHLPETAYDMKTTGALPPSRISRFFPAPHGPLRRLVIAASATADALARAEAMGLSVLVVPVKSDAPVHGHLIDSAGRTHHILVPTGSAPHREHPNRRGPTPWGAIALAFELLATTKPRTQSRLASTLGLTQARVSQTLASWSWVERTSTGYCAPDPAPILDWLQTTYPTARGGASWLSLDSALPATKAVALELKRLNVPYALTGEMAADLLAPWARPARATLLVDQLTDLAPAGCTPAAPDDANVVLVLNEDPWGMHRTIERENVRVADPWRVWLELVRDGRDDAAEHLQRRLEVARQ